MSDRTQHARFLSRLRKSRDAVWVVGWWLGGRGHTVEISPIRYAPTAAEADKFIDRGDLWIIDPDKRRRIEVKGISSNFTGRWDWPFKEVFVSNRDAVDRAMNVAAYITVSRDLCYGAIVKAETRSSWYLTDRLVRNTGNVETNYACPLDLVGFVKLVGDE